MRPNIGDALAACLTDKPGLNIGEPHFVGPSLGLHRDRVAALVIGAIDQDAERARRAHLAKGDLLELLRIGCRYGASFRRLLCNFGAA